MSEAKTIARYGQIYAAANIIGRAGGLILIPVYTHVLTLAEYGVYTVLLTVMDMFALIFGMGVSKAMGRFYFDYDEEDPRRKHVVSTTVIGFCALSLVFIALSYPLAHFLVRLIFGDGEYAGLFAMAGAAMAMAILFEIAVGYVVIRKWAWPFLALSTAKSGAILAANLVFVIWLQLGVYGIIYAMLTAFGILAVGITLWCLGHVGVKFDSGLLRKLIAFGAPLVPSAFANSAMRLVERTFITQYAGVAALAVYGLADRLTSLLQMFIATPFSQIFTVRRFESISKGEDQSEFHTVFLLFAALMAFAAFLMALFGAEGLALIAPPTFQGALALIPILALCHILSAINLNIELGILYKKKTWIIPSIAGISLVAAIVLNWVLVWRFGVMGAAVAFLCVNIIRLILTIMANIRWGEPEIRLDWARAGVLLATATGTGLLIAGALGPEISPALFVAKAFAAAGAFIAIVYSPALDPPARAAVLSLRPRFGKSRAGA